jgi:hypothetical protein
VFYRDEVISAAEATGKPITVIVLVTGGIWV